MPRASDSKLARVDQAEFDRLTGASRDDWRKWERRQLVASRAKRVGYAWPEIVEAIGLKALERAGGMSAVVSCWDDVRDGLRGSIRQPTLDLVLDPGVSTASAPKMRAFLSTN